MADKDKQWMNIDEFIEKFYAKEPSRDEDFRRFFYSQYSNDDLIRDESQLWSRANSRPEKFMTYRDAWTFADRRTGKRATAASFTSREMAQQELEGLLRTSRGDNRRLAPHLGVVKLNENTWGSEPGDVIAERYWEE